MTATTSSTAARSSTSGGQCGDGDDPQMTQMESSSICVHLRHLRIDFNEIAHFRGAVRPPLQRTILALSAAFATVVSAAASAATTTMPFSQVRKGMHGYGET